MPNWVTNSIQISGPSEVLEAFHSKFTQPVPRGTMRDGDELSGSWEIVELDEPAVSFWNFIAPPEEHWPEYFGAKGFGPDGSYGGGEWNWYQWNTANWGTKWDGRLEALETSSDSLYYLIETAWSPPEPVFYAMTEQFPELTIAVHCLEEQGWGFEADYEGGILTSRREWDIPQMHSEQIAVWGSCFLCESDANENPACDAAEFGS